MGEPSLSSNFLFITDVIASNWSEIISVPSYIRMSIKSLAVITFIKDTRDIRDAMSILSFFIVLKLKFGFYFENISDFNISAL